MSRYALRRSLIFVPTLVGVLTVAFLMIRLAPGDPVDVLLGDYGGRNSEMAEDLRQRLGLDRPLFQQYLQYVAGVLTGDLGTSFRTGRSVADDIVSQLPYTLMLTLSGASFALALGVPAGLLAAMRHGSWVDALVTTVAMLWVASPSFWFAILLIHVFAFGLGWLPVFGAGRLDDPASLAWHLVLPTVAVGARSAALVMRMARSAMLEVLRSDYVRTARAKGLSGIAVLRRHAMRNAAIPVVTVIGLDVAYLLSGTVVIETVFSRPGLGKLVVDAVYARDYVTVQSGIVVFAVMVLLVNLIVDLAYAWIDPRIRYA